MRIPLRNRKPGRIRGVAACEGYDLNILVQSLFLAGEGGHM